MLITLIPSKPVKYSYTFVPRHVLCSQSRVLIPSFFALVCSANCPSSVKIHLFALRHDSTLVLLKHSMPTGAWWGLSKYTLNEGTNKALKRLTRMEGMIYDKLIAKCKI